MLLRRCFEAAGGGGARSKFSPSGLAADHLPETGAKKRSECDQQNPNPGSDRADFLTTLLEIADALFLAHGPTLYNEYDEPQQLISAYRAC